MWQGNEIKQNDSGLVVSNKLDDEFARIQNVEQGFSNKFANLVYTDQITVADKTKDKLIVSPWTMWFILDPLFLRVDDVEKVTSHISEQFFDGKFWLRSDVPIEFFGTVDTIENTDDTFYITAGQVRSLEATYDNKYLMQDGSTPLLSGYVPVDNLDVVTKEYADSLVLDLAAKVMDHYVEFPPSAQNDTVFTVAIGLNNFIVYLNGVLQRRVKYSFTSSSVTFHAPLDKDDEVTIYVGGGK